MFWILFLLFWFYFFGEHANVSHNSSSSNSNSNHYIANGSLLYGGILGYGCGSGGSDASVSGRVSRVIAAGPAAAARRCSLGIFSCRCGSGSVVSCVLFSFAAHADIYLSIGQAASRRVWLGIPTRIRAPSHYSFTIRWRLRLRIRVISDCQRRVASRIRHVVHAYVQQMQRRQLTQLAARSFFDAHSSAGWPAWSSANTKWIYYKASASCHASARPPHSVPNYELKFIWFFYYVRHSRCDINYRIQKIVSVLWIE